MLESLLEALEEAAARRRLREEQDRGVRGGSGDGVLGEGIAEEAEVERSRLERGILIGLSGARVAHLKGAASLVDMAAARTSGVSGRGGG